MAVQLVFGAPVHYDEADDPYAALREEESAYDRRVEANRRVRCTCGRFAKAGRSPHTTITGEFTWSVICSKNGEVWIS